MNPCFFELAKVCAKVFIKKEVVCLFLAFIDNMFFFNYLTIQQCQYDAKRGKNPYGIDSVALIQKKFISEKRNRNRAFTFFLFGLNKTTRKNKKEVTLLSLLA